MENIHVEEKRNATKAQYTHRQFEGKKNEKQMLEDEDTYLIHLFCFSFGRRVNQANHRSKKIKTMTSMECEDEEVIPCNASERVVVVFKEMDVNAQGQTLARKRFVFILEAETRKCHLFSELNDFIVPSAC